MAKNGKNLVLPFILICCVILIVVVGLTILSNRRRLFSEKELSFEVVDLGNLSVKDSGYFVINTENELKELLTKSNENMSGLSDSSRSNLKFTFSESTIPEIDFSKNTLIVIFMGEVPTSGYRIDISKVVESKSEVNIYFKEISPGKDCLVNQVITYPYKAFKISKVLKKVQFHSDKIIENCNQ